MPCGICPGVRFGTGEGSLQCYSVRVPYFFVVGSRFSNILLGDRGNLPSEIHEFSLKDYAEKALWGHTGAENDGVCASKQVKQAEKVDLYVSCLEAVMTRDTRSNR